MMKRLAAAAVILTNFTYGAETASAQQALPTNFPPASYTGSQFVDNSGCVFVRAGFDGVVNWVPRMTRQRKQICGQTPTFKAGTTAVAAAPQVAPKQITLPTQPAPERYTAATAGSVAAPRVIKAPASKPVAAEPPRIIRPVPTAAPKVVTQVPAPSAGRAPSTYQSPTQLACANGQTSRQVNGRSVPIRCGPQTAPHVTIIRRGDAPTGPNVYYNRNSWESGALAPQTRIVPRHIYEARDTQIASVPAGYRPAWSDDRLNPYRAMQTVEGVISTQHVWTNQVPRRLVSQGNPKTGLLKSLWTGGYRHKIKEPVIAYRAEGSYPPANVQMDYAAQAGYRDEVVSSRGSNPAQGGGYVEIGVFTTEAKLDAAVSRLRKIGFPIATSDSTHGGRAVQRLRVGPYGSDMALTAALSAVQSSGYTQAYIR